MADTPKRRRTKPASPRAGAPEAPHLSERRHAEQALRESEQRFRLLVESVRDYAIFMLDPEGRVATWNAGAERIKGYSADEILGQHFSRFYPQDKIADDFPAFELAGAARDGRFEDEGWRIRKDGSRFWANVVITALRDDDGTLLGFAKVTRDLTARRAAEEQARHLAAEEAARIEADRRSVELQRLSDELQEQAMTLEEQAMELEAQTEEAQTLTEEMQQTNEQLERALAEADAANRAKADFLKAMSHELRTPLNAIGGYADLLLAGVRGAVTPEQAQDIERIRRNQQHLLGVINDILNYARLEAGQLTYDLGPVPLAEVVASVTPMIEPLTHARGVVMEQRSCHPDAVAHADRTKVAQILLNLLSNAAKFTPPGGRVTIECVAADGRVALTVADTGPGVPADQRAAVFEPFVQLGRSLTSGHEGSGLGLAISRDLARAMHGDLTVGDSAGGGATFTLALPAM